MRAVRESRSRSRVVMLQRGDDSQKVKVNAMRGWGRRRWRRMMELEAEVVVVESSSHRMAVRVVRSLRTRR